VRQIGARIDAAKNAVVRRFPEHHVYLRSNGKVRLLKVGTRVQIMAVTTAFLVAGWMGVATVATVSGAGNIETVQAKQAELVKMERTVTAMRADVNELQGDVAAKAAALEQRQKFLASLLSGQADTRQLAALMPKMGPSVDELMAETDHDDVLRPFKIVESEQLAFVDKATVAAEARYRDTQALLRRLGLDSARFVNQSTFAMGGPYEQANAGAAAEPAFKELFLSWKKVDQLEKAMASIPSYQPVKNGPNFTSGFGVRFDPFNGRTAMHAGVDMAGRYGEPIYASADGIVDSAGWNGAYGNAIDIGHGRGLSTRYGHLSRVLVRAGDAVKKGDLIGRMGSTGRSTGTHLHYEVRVDGRAVNPMPFLQASNYVLAIQSRANSAQGGPEIAAAN
jgi:murein DD-endopeptidase MepM/ murein hydrolase activator NlpD